MLSEDAKIRSRNFIHPSFTPLLLFTLAKSSFTLGRTIHLRSTDLHKFVATDPGCRLSCKKDNSLRHPVCLLSLCVPLVRQDSFCNKWAVHFTAKLRGWLDPQTTFQWRGSSPALTGAAVKKHSFAIGRGRYCLWCGRKPFVHRLCHQKLERRDQRAGGILEPSCQTMLSGLLVSHAKGHALAPFLHNVGHWRMFQRCGGRIIQPMKQLCAP